MIQIKQQNNVKIFNKIIPIEYLYAYSIRVNQVMIE